MRVAWVTHHLVKDEQRDGVLLPGLYAGGAEINDAVMRSHCPDRIQIDVIAAADWQTAMDYERVVITGTDHLTDEAMVQLATRKPLVWIQHAQHRSRAKAHLFQQADRFVTMSALHMAHEASWTGRADTFVHSPVWDTEEVPVAAKEPVALWAARNHPAKGRINARIIAERMGVPLIEVTNQPREVVLEHMARAQWFIHWPKEFDACPRTVIEATLAQCEVITNPRLVGRLEPGDPKEVLKAQPPKFWAMV